jgi:class 3 adenylate cyclase
VIALRQATPQAPLDVGPRSDTAGLPRQLARRFTLVIAPINLVIATVTYVFVAYVVPLPGPAPPGRARTTVLIAAIVGVAAAWAACELWGRHSFIPIRCWLERGGEPDEVTRTRAVRQALHQAGHTLMVWLIAGLGFGAVDVTVGGSAAAGGLMAVMVVVGGLSASALTYLAVEWMMRPVIALALAADPPVRPRSTGIATRIYLAWEFGTAAAVCGAVVVATAYLAGGGMSPRRMAATVIFLGVIALAVGLITLLVAIRSVSHPVRGLRDAMTRVEAGDDDVQVPVNDGGEVGLLQAGFNRMVAGLRERDRIRDLFGRHVGEEVARSALARGLELGGEVRDVAVLFVDVIGSTPFASARDPHEVVETLNRFFGIVVEVVTWHGGWVNKFEGDAALCAFGAPAAHPDAATAALSAARELRRRLRLELDAFDAAVGVSAGPVVAGNIGAANRYEYTVIGDAVNEAARLTQLAKRKPSRVLASEAIVSRAGVREAERWSVGESVLLRGRPRPTRVAVPGWDGPPIPAAAQRDGPAEPEAGNRATADRGGETVA